MDASRKSKAFAFFLATLAWFGVLLQCYLSLKFAVHNGKSIDSGLGTFFSYFTVLTNLLVAASLTMALIGPASIPGKWFSRPDLVAGIGVSIAFVGLSYHVLLRNVWHPQGAQLLADTMLHYAVPALYVLYWWIDSPKAAVLRWTDPLVWSIYPTAYLVFALIRGSMVASYPYFFIDAAALGYGRTLLNALGLLLVFIALGILFVALSRARQRMRS